MHVDQTVGQQLVNVFPGRLLAALDERRELLQRLPRGPVERLADVGQPVLQPAPDRAVRPRPLDLVVDVEVGMCERLELLTQRKRGRSLQLRHHVPLPRSGESETSLGTEARVTTRSRLAMLQ